VSSGSVWARWSWRLWAAAAGLFGGFFFVGFGSWLLYARSTGAIPATRSPWEDLGLLALICAGTGVFFATWFLGVGVLAERLGRGRGPWVRPAVYLAGCALISQVDRVDDAWTWLQIKREHPELVRLAGDRGFPASLEQAQARVLLVEGGALRKDWKTDPPEADGTRCTFLSVPDGSWMACAGGGTPAISLSYLLDKTTDAPARRRAAERMARVCVPDGRAEDFGHVADALGDRGPGLQLYGGVLFTRGPERFLEARSVDQFLKRRS
jgi:hypothetical protein